MQFWGKTDSPSVVFWHKSRKVLAGLSVCSEVEMICI